jgi:uncharacterized protein
VRGAYLQRYADAEIGALLADMPALMVVGPRATGKTTTAARHAKTVICLDQAASAAPFVADPDGALDGLPEPALLDEWQSVPGVLAAVKRAVDRDSRPGRFILTGSVRANLEHQVWPGTGRIVQLNMSGLAVREQRGLTTPRPSFLERIAASGLDGLPRIDSDMDVRDYLTLALRSGFPEAAEKKTERARRVWLGGYVNQLMTRDAELLGPGRDPDRLRRYFEAYAVSTAGVIEERKLFEAAGINRKTADAYEALLNNLFVAYRLPAWSSSRIKRLTRSPKRYLADPALAAVALELDVDSIFWDVDMVGRLLDTFVVAQLRAEQLVAGASPRLYHLRQEQGRHEVDIIAEIGGFRVVAIEIKAAAAPADEATKHLRWLRDELGDRFLRGVVLHTGRFAYELDEKIVAAPVSALWA